MSLWDKFLNLRNLDLKRNEWWILFYHQNSCVCKCGAYGYNLVIVITHIGDRFSMLFSNRRKGYLCDKASSTTWSFHTLATAVVSEIYIESKPLESKTRLWKKVNLDFWGNEAVLHLTCVFKILKSLFLHQPYRATTHQNRCEKTIPTSGNSTGLGEETKKLSKSYLRKFLTQVKISNACFW